MYADIRGARTSRRPGVLPGTVLLIACCAAAVDASASPTREAFLIDDDSVYWDARIGVSTGEVLSAEEAQLYRTYAGALGRVPDAAGYTWWLGEIRAGTRDLPRLAADFIWSAEFLAFFDASRGDGIDNAAFVNHIYRNVFGRAPDADGLAFWYGELEGGRRTQAEVLVAMTQSNEYVEQTLDAVVDFRVPVGAPPPEPVARIPLPAYDEGSSAWRRWINHVGASGGGAAEHALIAAATGDSSHCATAIDKAQAVVDSDTVAGNQYLKSGRQYADVFKTLAWCDVDAGQAAAWTAWGRRQLGATDGSVRDSIWWSNRWSRNNPANNYYHSFVMATSLYAMATGDVEWLDWLRDDRLSLLYGYYAGTPEGGSREGTAYGESHREVLRLAKLWRDYDGTEILPQAFIDNSIRYWVHATAPGHRWVALIGDQTRTHGKTDGYHRDIIDNALQLAQDPEAIAIGRWQLARLPPPSSTVFYGLELLDHPADGHPPLATEYHALGAGHFFARDGWGDEATYLYFTAGKHDEAHQQEDQGAFAVWADGRWQTTSDSPWTHGGIAQDVAYQNVMRFASAENIHDSVSTLAWSTSARALRVEMDLSAAVGEPWRRSVEWVYGSRELRIVDECSTDAVFGFETPSADDTRAPYVSAATASTRVTASGFESVVRW